MEIKNNQVVELRNGSVGVVMTFNGNPSIIIFKAYSTPLSKYDKELKHKNEKYDIMSIYDGSSIIDPSAVYKNLKVDDLPLVWQRE